LELVDSILETSKITEAFDEFKGCPHSIEGRNLENPRVVEVDNAVVLVLLQ